MTLSLIFLVAALVLFILDAVGISSRVGLQSLGLTCVVAAMIAGSAVVG